MSGYIREIEKTFAFQGQEVKCKIVAIDYQSYLGIEKLNDRTNITEAVNYLSSIVYKFVTLVTPPTAADGSPVTIDEICTQAYFTDLLSEIGRTVISTGRVQDPLASGASLPSG